METLELLYECPYVHDDWGLPQLLCHATGLRLLRLDLRSQTALLPPGGSPGSFLPHLRTLVVDTLRPGVLGPRLDATADTLRSLTLEPGRFPGNLLQHLPTFLPTAKHLRSLSITQVMRPFIILQAALLPALSKSSLSHFTLTAHPDPTILKSLPPQSPTSDLPLAPLLHPEPTRTRCTS